LVKERNRFYGQHVNRIEQMFFLLQVSGGRSNFGKTADNCQDDDYMNEK